MRAFRAVSLASLWVVTLAGAALPQTDPCLVAQAMPLNGTRTGSLSTSDCTLDDVYGNGDLSYFDLWVVTVTQQGRLVVDLESSQFDAYLFLVNETFLTDPANAVIIAENDDANDSTLNSRVSALLNPGTYVIGANSFDVESGGYTLRTSFTTETVPPDCLRATAVGINALVSGSLSTTDCTFDDLLGDGDFTYLDLYSVVVLQRGTLTVTMRSSAIDAYLVLGDDAVFTNPAGAYLIAENDDMGGATSDAQLAVTLAPGTYAVMANSFDVEIGSYTLQTSFVARPAPNCNSPVATIGTDQQLAGSLAHADCTQDDLSGSGVFAYFDGYSITLPQAGTLTVTMTASAVDTFLVLGDAKLFSDPAHATTIAVNDDADLTGTRSSIERFLPAGTYSIEATTAFVETGNYLLQTSFQPGGTAHSADTEGDFDVSLSELLRVIQLYNLGSLHCAAGTEDGYAPGAGDRTCSPHASDYNPQDWKIGLSELLRAIQFYNSGGYHPDATGEDGYAPGL